MNILAFAAHPDDVEEMCFGTLMKYHAQGDQIYIVPPAGTSAPTGTTPARSWQRSGKRSSWKRQSRWMQR